MPNPTPQALVSTASPGTRSRGVRDDRLDFWRALCLIDMVLVHMIYVAGVNFGVIQRTLGEYTRFAAGGFVFVAGLSIGAIFLPRTFLPGGRKKVYFSLWRRALYILCVHFAATLSFICVDLITGMRSDIPSIPRLIRDIFLFREGGDLLPLYVIVVASSPFMLELIRRRLGWLLALGSIGLFALGQNHPWLFSSPIHDKFPVILWQSIFTAGLLFGILLPRYTALRSVWKVSFFCVAALLSLTLWAGDFRSELGWTWPVLPLSFVKVPLSIGEILRYFGLIFSVILGTDLLWKFIAKARWVALVNRMGRRSLAVYVSHVWVVGLLSLVAWNTPKLGAWQMLLAIPAVGALWCVARGLDWWDSRPVSAVWRSRWIPIPLGIAAAAFACWVVVAIGMTTPAVVVTPIAISPTVTNSLDQTRDDADETDTPQDPFFDPQDSADIMTA